MPHASLSVFNRPDLPRFEVRGAVQAILCAFPEATATGQVSAEEALRRAEARRDRLPGTLAEGIIEHRRVAGRIFGASSRIELRRSGEQPPVQVVVRKTDLTFLWEESLDPQLEARILEFLRSLGRGEPELVR